MICCLPVWPGNAAVRRADWMTSLALRRYDVGAGLDDVRRQQPRPDELLGDRRGAAPVALDRLDRRGDHRRDVEAVVLPERAVLGGRRRVEDERRDVAIVDDLALRLAGSGRAPPCRSGRRRSSAGRIEASRAPGVRQVLRQHGDRAHRDQAGRPDAGHDDDEEDQGHQDEAAEDQRRARSSPGARRGAAERLMARRPAVRPGPTGASVHLDGRHARSSRLVAHRHMVSGLRSCAGQENLSRACIRVAGPRSIRTRRPASPARRRRGPS